MTARLVGLYVYPIKSAAGLRCQTVELTESGFKHDREWMVVDANGRFVTQRENGRLALLHTRLVADQLQISSPELAGRVTLETDHGGPRKEVRVWRSVCAALDAGEEAAEFISLLLRKPVRLVRFDQARRRQSNPEWTHGMEVSTLFSDGYPLLVLSQASIDDLAQRSGQNLEVERFRPNVLIDGVEPYAEDSAQWLRVASTSIRLTKPCTRCVIPTLDPATGIGSGDEPLATLKGYRMNLALNGAVFGRNAYALGAAGTKLTVGAAVSLQ